MKKCAIAIGVILLILLTWREFNKTTEMLEIEPSARHTENNEVVFMVPVMDPGKKIPFETLADDYNRVHDRQIVIEKIPEEDYQKVLNMKMLQGDAPDMFIVEEDWVKVFDENDWLAGAAVPLSVESYRLICNLDLFKRTGTNPGIIIDSIEDVYTIGSRINDLSVGIVYGFVPYLDSDKHGYVRIIERIGKGNGFYHYNSATGLYDFGVYEDWIQMMVNMQNESIVSENFLDIRKEVALNQFESGIVGMLIVSSEDMYWMDDGAVSDMKILPVPIDSYEEEVGISGMFFGVSGDTDNASVCNEFLEIMTSFESEQNIYEQGYYIPAKHYKRIMSAGVSADHYLEEFLVDDYKDTSYLDPLRNDETGIRFTVYKQIFEGELTVAEGLEKLSSIFNEMLY